MNNGGLGVGLSRYGMRVSEILHNSIPKGFHTVPGIYFLIRSGKIVYVGKSLCVYARIHSHIQEGTKDFTSWSHLSLPESLLDCMELHYIKVLKPEYNGSWSSKDLDYHKSLQVHLMNDPKGVLV